MIRQFGMHVQTATSHSIAHAWREIRPDDGGVVVVEGIHTDKDNPTFLELHEAGLAVLPRSLAQLWPIIPGAPQLGRTSHGPQDPPVDVDLEEMVPVEWRVTHVDGTPAVGARIEVVAFTARRSVTKSRILPVAIAGRDGSLRMLLPPHGDYVVAVIHDFGGAIVGVHTGRGSLDEIHSVPVVLESAVTVTGTVVDRAGQPAPMAMLWFAVPHPRGRDPATEPAAAGPDRALTDITEQLPEFAYLGVQEHFEPRSCRADEKGEFAVRFPLRGRGWVLRAGGEDVAIEGAALGRERVTLMHGR